MEEGPDDPDQTGTPATTGTETFCGFPKLGISSLERWTLFLVLPKHYGVKFDEIA